MAGGPLNLSVVSVGMRTPEQPTSSIIITFEPRTEPDFFRESDSQHIITNWLGCPPTWWSLGTKYGTIYVYMAVLIACGVFFYGGFGGLI